MPKEQEPILVIERSGTSGGFGCRMRRVRELAEGENPADFELAPKGSTVTEWEPDNAN